MQFKIISHADLKECLPNLTEAEISDIVKNCKIDSKSELNRIENAWNIREKEILEAIKIKTGIQISTEEITCSINPYDSNGFYGEDNIVLGVVSSNSEDDIMVISHELFHIFYWRKLKDLGLFGSYIGKEQRWEWMLAEVTVYLLQKDLKFLWPNSKIELYPETRGVYKKVKDIWKNESFENYLIKSYNIIKDGR